MHPRLLLLLTAVQGIASKLSAGFSKNPTNQLNPATPKRTPKDRTWRQLSPLAWWSENMLGCDTLEQRSGLVSKARPGQVSKLRLPFQFRAQLERRTIPPCISQTEKHKNKTMLIHPYWSSIKLDTDSHRNHLRWRVAAHNEPSRSYTLRKLKRLSRETMSSQQASKGYKERNAMGRADGLSVENSSCVFGKGKFRSKLKDMINILAVMYHTHRITNTTILRYTQKYLRNHGWNILSKGSIWVRHSFLACISNEKRGTYSNSQKP